MTSGERKVARCVPCGETETETNGLANLGSPETQILDRAKERELLEALADCKRKLAEALAKVEGAEVPNGADDPQTLAQYIASFYAGDRPAEARLGAVFRRYSELRGKLALANMRLVAHVAKRFRDRGIVLLRPAPGRLLRPPRGDRPLRPDPRDQAGDLRDLVDPPGDAARRRLRGVSRSG